MEIERKFLIQGFPSGESAQRYEMEQGYLATEPVTVRIRRESTQQGTDYILCFKGKGLLSREEIEIPLCRADYEALCTLLPAPPIRKIRQDYLLQGGFRLECNQVEPGAPDSFYYAEVEFSSEEEAKAFSPPAWLGEEVTYDPSYTMKAFWEKRRKGAPCKELHPPAASLPR